MTRYRKFYESAAGSWSQIIDAATKMNQQLVQQHIEIERLLAALVRIGILNASGKHPDPEIDQAIRDAAVDRTPGDDMMCNACGFYCCAYDGFDGCGCDHCPEPRCWSDDPDEYDGDDDDGFICVPICRPAPVTSTHKD